MKYIFFTLWLLVSIILGVVGVGGIVRQIDVNSVLFLSLVFFYSFCCFQLIQAVYPKDSFLANPDRGYWLCWLVLPLGFFVLIHGLNIITSNSYHAEPNGRRRLFAWFMNSLADTFGAWLPGLLILMFGSIVLTMGFIGISKFSKLKNRETT